ncbi:hypothetical protein ISF_07730 [Cordyceps fumosorosea ARSEF 2679]|uniref:AMP-dependent synthetase/ligase n=1 Tax=Cordyceps fumosorosea (strain ARSEF 2679) TaxID=1081104 RepID=A0A162IDJ6_CORFA|nr:hypothetical protein ISF_07730 [Cordyceps fumosorosea ARSEF 2679]OAA55625.1 hypothetical protein ISF_07730 [Cordyceps fumosorosea ARSEF 2679]
MVYPLPVVLAVANKHCFYDQSIKYPLPIAAVNEVAQQTADDQQAEQLSSWPLLHKKTLYTTIERLVNDTSPENTYRQSSYVSITGGGGGSTPLFFATDSTENRRQRAEFGRLIASTGVLSRRDLVVTMHSGGGLYRALDLTLEVMECAGACALAAGSHMSAPQVVNLLVRYRANVLSGDSSQIINVVNYLSALPAEERGQVRLDKLVYTSEVLTAAQRALVRATLGEDVRVCSLLASAEAGPWAVSNPGLTGERTAASSDFLYDTRTMTVEVLPMLEDGGDGKPLPDGEAGMIVLTSLSRLRNPLVRYVCGDVGSLSALPEAAAAQLPEADRAHVRVLRLEGRDRRFSFSWQGNYVDFANVAAVVEDPIYGVLQWQVVLEDRPVGGSGLEPHFELRVLLGAGREAIPVEEMAARVRVVVALEEAARHMFAVVVAESTDGFEKSKTGNKVVRFIDRRE